MNRFKPKLVTEDCLKSEYDQFKNKFSPFLKLHEQQIVSDSELAICYLIFFLNSRFPKDWASGRQDVKLNHQGYELEHLPFEFHPKLATKISRCKTLGDILQSFSLKSTPKSVNQTLLNWLNHSWPLELVFHIPSPKSLLEKQKQGMRYVTLIKDERMTKYILGERDQLSFLMHDLIHAFRFYSDPSLTQGQIHFYHLLWKTFDYFDLENPDFRDEFEYLIADMNAYPIHLLKCLKSAMIHYFDDNYFQHWMKLVSAPQEINNLNTPLYHPSKMDTVLLDWLSGFKE